MNNYIIIWKPQQLKRTVHLLCWIPRKEKKSELMSSEKLWELEAARTALLELKLPVSVSNRGTCQLGRAGGRSPEKGRWNPVARSSLTFSYRQEVSQSPAEETSVATTPESRGSRSVTICMLHQVPAGQQRQRWWGGRKRTCGEAVTGELTTRKDFHRKMPFLLTLYLNVFRPFTPNNI